MAQRVGIVVVPPALCRQKHASADQRGEVVGNVHLTARVFQAGSHLAKDPAALEYLSAQPHPDRRSADRSCFRSEATD